MKTPICDFVKEYDKSSALKLHMPGHKGKIFLGIENLDITEIEGADSLYEASGIIAESEAYASELFGCSTYYSTEGSSQCIKAMMQLISLYAQENGEKPYILAGRNAHKAFHSAVALLDIDVDWIYPENKDNYLSCNISAERLSKIIKNSSKKPTAVYLTSPDYLGNVIDIMSISKICHENDILLAIDNAHGAYLRFLENSLHPIDLGADICCDSAHKTLPVLTGGAYLHLGERLNAKFDAKSIKDAMLLFGSTSPSYIILQSLDVANKYLENYSSLLMPFIARVDSFKQKLIDCGYELYGSEKLKITVQAKKYGYTGYDFAKILSKNGVICEFCDPDFVVLMLTPEIVDEKLHKFLEIMLSIPKREEIKDNKPQFVKLKKSLSIREAMLSPSECISIEESIGRVVAMSSVGCPPAVPIAVAGEVVDEGILDCFKYYGINKINVVK